MDRFLIRDDEMSGEYSMRKVHTDSYSKNLNRRGRLEDIAFGLHRQSEPVIALNSSKGMSVLNQNLLKTYFVDRQRSRFLFFHK